MRPPIVAGAARPASPPGLALRVRIRIRRPAAAWGVPLVLGGVLGIGALAGTGYTYQALDGEGLSTPPAGMGAPAPAPGLAREAAALRRRLTRTAPPGRYIVIDRTDNRLTLWDRGRVIATMVCSAGSGRILEEAGGQQRRWVFDTPRGAFRILHKSRNPVWRKPDWAFLEEGEPIPDDPAERFENGVLGEYGLYFGDGYLIHGTLYERLLGRSVTHGCIRLGRDDLRRLYESVPLGTAVYIY